jgi:serine/threonine protein kinase
MIYRYNSQSDHPALLSLTRSSPMPLISPVPPGTLLESRYEVVRFLGHGGFGRTYLAKDQHRFNEFCVLKEFAPQMHDPGVIQKAEELFQREAGTLYKLEHPQIPEFRALSSVQYEGEKMLFLVEQFVDGYNYGEWVEQGHCLSPAQGLALIRDLLPVLAYIHAKGVIHRDIAPDNLMCDRHTNKPILIDFGSVKQIAQTALQMVGGVQPPTQIHKPGYTPLEQIKGEVYPNSDLYALAVTVLVLMTGQSPIDLFDASRQEWNWKRFIQLDSRLENVLLRMLARHQSDRYRSADEVVQALSGIELSQPMTSPIPATVIPPTPVVGTPAAANPAFSQVKTIAVAPAWNAPPTAVPAQPVGYSAHHQAAPTYSQPPAQTIAPNFDPNVAVPVPRRSRGGNWLWRSIKAILLLPFKLIGAVLKLLWGGIRLVDMMFTWIFRLIMIAVTVALLAVAAVFGKPDWLPNIALPSFPSGATASSTSQGCQDLQGRAERSGLTYAQLNTQVNQRFYQRYPQMKGKALSNSSDDQPLRDAWCEMADDLLDRAERR